jgi:hypothetical protein
VTKRRSTKKRLLLAAIALTIGTVLAALLVETTLRVFDPIGENYDREFTIYRTQAVQYAWETLPPAAPGTLPAGLDLDGRLYQHRPGLDLDLGSFRLRTNSLGCRGPEVLRPKPAGVYRIVVLGDSVAFGWGVDDEHTFVRRLETEWNTAHPERRLEVVNTALPMYDSNQELAALRELGLSLQPDLVLLVYVVNDVEPTRDVIEAALTGVAPPDDLARTLPDDCWSWASRQLAGVMPSTAKLLAAKSDLEGRVAKLLPAGARYEPEHFGRGVRGWPRCQAALLAIRDECRRAGVPLLVFDHSLPELPSLPPFCQANGIDLVPLRFSKADHRLGIVNSMLDTHANARGHDLLLQRLRAALDERRLLPR